jgi:hypothetical protein
MTETRELLFARRGEGEVPVELVLSAKDGYLVKCLSEEEAFFLASHLLKLLELPMVERFKKDRQRRSLRKKMEHGLG